MTARDPWSTSASLTRAGDFSYPLIIRYERRRPMFDDSRDRASASLHLASYYNSSMMM